VDATRRVDGALTPRVGRSDENARMTGERPEPWLLTDERLTTPLSGPLFVDISTITVDPAYVEAAARRAARGEDPRRPSRAAALLTALVVIGLLLAVAGRQARERAPGAARVRVALLEDTRRRTTATDALVGEQARLRAEAEAVRDGRLGASRTGQELAARLAALDLVVGTVAVSGPGIEVRLDDAPAAGGPDDPNADGKVRDRDLQEVVNALWAAGAEAVAVNGQRVSALTAIREAGQAILVDYRPLSAPYVVAAVGDPDTVEPAFTGSETAGRFRTYVGTYGLTFEVRRRDRLTLPAAETTRLRHAVAGANP
jgi:uncharacterized protein YlxW (UPF0749 family)